MDKNTWDTENMCTLSCRVRRGYADKLRAIAKAEETSVHRIIINLLDKFIADYEES